MATRSTAESTGSASCTSLARRKRSPDGGPAVGSRRIHNVARAPEEREELEVERCAKVGRARRAAGSRPRADYAQDHVDVDRPEVPEALVELHEGFDEVQERTVPGLLQLSARGRTVEAGRRLLDAGGPHGVDAHREGHFGRFRLLLCAPPRLGPRGRRRLALAAARAKALDRLVGSVPQGVRRKRAREELEPLRVSSTGDLPHKAVFRKLGVPPLLHIFRATGNKAGKLSRVRAPGLLFSHTVAQGGATPPPARRKLERAELARVVPR